MISAVEAFIKNLQVQNKSAHTVKNYQRDLQDFLGFYLADELELADDSKEDSEQALQAAIQSFNDWQLIDADSVRAFLAFRVQHGISARTLARQLSAIRSFYDFLILKNIAMKNPAKGVKAPKQPQPLPKSVDVDWMQRLLEQPIKSWQDVRDQAMF